MYTSDTSELAALISQRARDKTRILVALAGPPGSGKSTLAEHLAAELERAVVVPMDGFHLDNARLKDMGLLHRKGAPETFDADEFVRFVRNLRSAGVIAFPTFDRSRDAAVHNGGRIEKDARIILVEGNYLLLDSPPWTELAQQFDVTVALKVDRGILEQRLIQRWLDHGMTAEAARVRANENDLRNADRVIEQSRKPDITFGVAGQR